MKETPCQHDIYFMRLALHEARKGLGRTAPNPCVGAVVVKDGKVLARAWHRGAGTAHAEALALERCGGMAKGATLYVSLEPCNHQGRTPPCSETIIRSGIIRVVYALPDPNPVAGGGAKQLHAAGIALKGGVLAEESRRLNRPFFKWHETGLPWVTLKAATSLDGRIAIASGESKWISSPESRRWAHRLRSQSQAILVGIETVLADDPELTVRLPGFSGDSVNIENPESYQKTKAKTKKTRRNEPLKVVLDSSLRIPSEAKLIRSLAVKKNSAEAISPAPCCPPAVSSPMALAGECPASEPREQLFSAKKGNKPADSSVWVFCANKASKDRVRSLEALGVKVSRVETAKDTRCGLDLSQVLHELAVAGVMSLLVEGGGRVHGSFLRQKLADELVLFVAPSLLGADGRPAIGELELTSLVNAPRLKETSTRRMGDDLMIRGFF